ncbi:MAG: UbiA family prenyltransferase [Bellilinea sp.]
MSTAAYPVTTRRQNWFSLVWTRFWLYWVLIKDLQTGLLLVTAAAGYASGCCTNLNPTCMLGLMGSLFFATAGCTVLNMAFDRDIDALMLRTAHRPLPAGKISAREAWILGGLMTALGLIWALALDTLFGAMVAIGVVLNALVYTIWLKRRTPFAIIIGGMAGGMPVLAGRALASGQVDLTGLLMALGVLVWIPTHIMTFTIKYQEDYARAGIPTFPKVYGVQVTRWIIAASSLLVVVLMQGAAYRIGVPEGTFSGLAILGGAMLGLTALALLRPTRALNFALYKGASIYMLLAMILFVAGGL